MMVGKQEFAIYILSFTAVYYSKSRANLEQNLQQTCYHQAGASDANAF